MSGYLLWTCCRLCSTSFDNSRITYTVLSLVSRFQQSSQDAEPFGIEWLSANGLAYTTIPIGCVALIAFLAVKVGMHPRTLASFILLSRLVGSRPIVLGIPP